jgi:hypothetical protein
MSQITIGLLSAGKSVFRVFLSTQASNSQDFAAQELVKYLMESTKVSLQLVKDDHPVPKKSIILGDHPFIKKTFSEINFDELGDEGFYWLFNKDYIIIAGSKTRGTIYGVYSFLEEFLGIRWYDPECTIVPNHKNINLPMISKKKLPSLSYRIVTYLNQLDPDYSLKLKCNMNPFTDEDHGGGYFLSTAHLTHTFYQLVDPKNYYADHPEYFALVKGKRVSNLGQLCLSNSDVIQIATENVLKWFEEDPRIHSMGVIQNDVNNYCECEACKALEHKYGDVHSAPIINLCNTIATKLKEKYPDPPKYVHTIAYTYSLIPPQGLKVHERVLVVVCDMYPDCADHKPIGQDPLTENYVKYIKDWVRISPNVLAWHYAVDFVHFLMPFPNFKALYENTKIYQSLGLKGILFQGTQQMGVYGEFEEFRNWFLYKMLWDTTLGFDEIVNDFISGYYGKAAPVIKEFFDELHKTAELPWVKMHLYSGLEAGYLTKEFVVNYLNKIKASLEVVKSNPEVLAHVEKVLMSLDYSYLIFPVKYDVVLGKIYPQDLTYRTEVLSRFKQYIAKFNIKVAAEDVPVKSFINRQELITKENDILALAEIAPTVMGIMNSLIDKVKSSLDTKENFRPNEFIISVLKAGLHPMEISHWMNEKEIGSWTTDADIWTKKFNQENVDRLLHPTVPKTTKKQLPSMIDSLINGLPSQFEEFDKEKDSTDK